MDLPPEAARQGWRFSYQQARAGGLTWPRLQTAVRRGLLEVTAHGVYAVAGLAVDPLEAHAQLLRDAQLSATQRWYGARRSAALLMGLPLIGRSPSVVQLTRDGNQQGAHGRDRHWRISPLPTADTWEYRGLDLCTPARTVIDIGRAESFRNGVVAADGALRRGVDPADLEAVLKRMSRWPGVARARAAVRFADGRAESPGESLVRVACRREGLPIPEPQVEVHLWGEFVGRVDGLFREALLVIESDGAVKFTGPLVLPRLLARHELIRDAGLDIIRTNWDETFRDTSVFGRRVRERLRERGSRALPPGVELRSTRAEPQRPHLGESDALAA